ncbi:Ribosomal protein L11 methyltransferase [Dissostichus eleginoides]|uniref:Ribosomal protein L11 methyltransferase n=1 Tax=Dissostichus eleginoides TaxID=100907 RepID=A0AAD9FFG3_DISEL|nr:Ribosomal protein L11 methyltransferase [Dissostichus eleginoides]
MLRISGVLALLALGLSASHTKGTDSRVIQPGADMTPGAVLGPERANDTQRESAETELSVVLKADRVDLFVLPLARQLGVRAKSRKASKNKYCSNSLK